MKFVKGLFIYVNTLNLFTTYGVEGILAVVGVGLAGDTIPFPRPWFIAVRKIMQKFSYFRIEIPVLSQRRCPRLWFAELGLL